MIDVVIVLLDEFLIWIMISSIGWLWIKREKKAALLTFLSAGLGWSISQAIKHFYPTPRPYLREGVSALIPDPPTDGSFPSGHTTTAFAIATCIFIFNRKWGIVAYLFALAVGILRIMVRVHYGIDIAGGIILGISVSWILNKLYIRVKK